MDPKELKLDERATVIYTGGDPLGKGATSTVWPCVLKITSGEETEEKDVAVKCAFGSSVEEKKMLESELKVWKEIAGHENVVKLWGGKLRDSSSSSRAFMVYSVMEMVPSDLRHLLFHDKDFGTACTYKDVINILLDICQGLKHLHAHGVIHHDLKPENVLVTENWKGKLADFGMARSIAPERQSITAVCGGTLNYMAPEIMAAPRFRNSDVRVTKAVDVYSLGALMWVMLNRVRVNGNPEKIENFGREIQWGGVEGSRSIWCGGPSEFCDLVEACLQFGGVSDASCNHGRPSIKKVIDTLELMLREPWALRRVPSYSMYDGYESHQDMSKELLNSIKSGDLSEVQSWLSKGAHVDVKDDEERGVLHYACDTRNVEILNELIAIGADVHAVDNEGRSPLYMAAWHGHVEAMNVLTASGADVDHEKRDGWTPLHRAARNGDVRGIHVLASSGINLKKSGLDTGANLLAVDKNGWSPLHFAAQNGHVGAINALISSGCVVAEGAELHQKHKNGMTPLHRAAENGHPEAVNALTAAGADVGNGNKYGWTPLHMAAQNGSVEAIKALIKAGAAVSPPSSKNATYKGVVIHFGSTPLHFAAAFGRYHAVKALIEKGADKDKKDVWLVGRRPRDLVPKDADDRNLLLKCLT